MTRFGSIKCRSFVEFQVLIIFFRCYSGISWWPVLVAFSVARLLNFKFSSYFFRSVNRFISTQPRPQSIVFGFDISWQSFWLREMDNCFQIPVHPICQQIIVIKNGWSSQIFDQFTCWFSVCIIFDIWFKPNTKVLGFLSTEVNQDLAVGGGD